MTSAPPNPKDKLKTLPDKFPDLFANRWGPRPRTKDRPFGFECCDGWYRILCALLSIIQHRAGRYREVQRIKDNILEKGDSTPDWIPRYFEDNPKDPLDSFTICQIKEKFGGLRFYYDCDVSLPEIDGAIAMAESMSFVTCELCGLPGSHSSGSGCYVQTLCPSCFEAREACYGLDAD